jgi:membrane dipeptidase
MLLFLLTGLFSFGTIVASAQPRDSKIQRKADRIHKALFTIDTHADVPINMMKNFDLALEHDFKKDGSQIDIPRMKKGGMDAMFFAVYMEQGRRTEEGHQEAKDKALAILDKIHSTVATYPQHLTLATRAHDGKKIEKKGKRAVYIGMENGWPIGNNLQNIQTYYDLGVRYISLTHSANNNLADASSDADGPEHNGLSPLGKQAVQKMNELGIMVDVSHASDATFYDIVQLSKAPIIASHSSCRALADVPRNMSDDMIKALAKAGGVIQINFVPAFLKKSVEQQEISISLLVKKLRQVDLTPEQQKEFETELAILKAKMYKSLPTATDAVNHIEHVIKLVGIDHVGIGMDLDGGGELSDMKDVSQIKVITTELVRRGYTKKEIQKIWGGNLLRVLWEVEKLSLIHI